MRRDAIRDRNEPEIVRALEAAGAQVARLSQRGLPDLLVGFRRALYGIEVKDGAQPPSERQLTKAQRETHDRFRSVGVEFRVVINVEQALEAIGVRVAR